MKKIAWESWSEKERDLLDTDSVDSILNDLNEEELEQIMQAENSLTPLMADFRSNIIQTPFGAVPIESILKPSDRWDCWLGYTNFNLTNKISDTIKIVDGVESLKVMSRYTFCVGIGKMFNFSNVRREIENAICK